MSLAPNIYSRSNRCLFIFILIAPLLLSLAGNACAQGKGHGVEVRLMSPPLTEAKPGEIVSVSFAVENAASEDAFEERLSIPDGWLLITPADVFRLGAKQSTVRILAFQVPRSAAAGEFSVAYHVRSKRDPAVSDGAELKVAVAAQRGLRFFIESAPDTAAAGESYEIKAKIANDGNSPVSITLSAKSAENFQIELSPQKATLPVGGNEQVTVSVKIPSKIKKNTRNTISLTASAVDDPSVRATVYVPTDILPIGAGIDLYHRIPAKLTLRAMGQRNGAASNGWDARLEGSGAIDEGGRRHMEFLLSGPDTNDKGFYGERDEYYMNYYDPGFDIRLGDQSYGLSLLTSYARYGRGAEIKYHPEASRFGVGGYAIKSRFSVPGWKENGAYAESSVFAGTKLKFNYLQKEYDSHETSPRIRDNICSMEGTFNLAKDSKLTVEYAKSEREASSQKLDDDAYRAELSGNIGMTRYYLNKNHAGPDFHGYYNDSDYMSGSLNIPFSKHTGGFISYSAYETNIDKRTDKGTASTEEKLFQTGVNYSFQNGWYAQLTYDDFKRKDVMPPAEYDFEERAWRFSIGRSVGKLNYRIEARRADQNDNIIGSSASLWNYSFYASYTPSVKLFFTFYGGFGDDDALAGSRLLSDQSNLGASFRWALADNITLSGWYTKYNFDSNNPESNQYNVELSYITDFERIWSIAIRRYDSENVRDIETDYVLSYSIPIGIPVGKKKSLGTVAGKVWQQNENGRSLLANAVVTLNGLMAVTDASGRFSLSAPPGDYLLNVRRSSVGVENRAAEKLPLKVAVEPGKTSDVELNIVKAASLRGRVVLISDSDTAAKGRLAVVGEPPSGSSALPDKIRGVLVEISREDEVLRTLSDGNGEFSFADLRPGEWKFMAYDNNIPPYHYIQNPKEDITLLPGDMKEIEVRVIPKKREIKMIDNGTLVK